MHLKASHGISFGCFVALSLGLALIRAGHAASDGDDFSERPSVTAAEILRRRGYIADELFVESRSGYILRLTRGRNPLISGGSLASKDPILFIHGVLTSANNFLLSSFNATPKDFTAIKVTSMSLEELQAQLADEPSARSLPLLASNLGHEVWLLDRRGAPGSQQLAGDPKSIQAEPSGQDGGSSAPARGVSLAKQLAFTLDTRFWNYSLDEQAADDLPRVLDFILENSPAGSRLSLVGHSAGGALALMALSLYPDQLGHKLSSCVLWSPAYATGNDNPRFVRSTRTLLPLVEAIVGPVPAPFLTKPMQATLMLICSSPVTWNTICTKFVDSLLGASGDREPAKPFIFAGQFFATSSHELAQLAQTTRYPNRTVHAFDFGPNGNRAAYGQPTPPAYNLTVLRAAPSLSFYVGATDALVTAADVQQTRAQLAGK
jgi:pimeloyl-ACP methyl ester carboxylesterase